jgi:hypothetical protein
LKDATERLHLLSSPWLAGVGHIQLQQWVAGCHLQPTIEINKENGISPRFSGDGQIGEERANLEKTVLQDDEIMQVDN